MNEELYDPECRACELAQHDYAELEQVTDDLAAWVRRLAQSLRKAAPDNELPSKALTRHVELVREMESRGYNHKSELLSVDLSRMDEKQFFTKIDREKSLAELIRRCPECAARHKEMQNAG